jgi:hypothetical protein
MANEKQGSNQPVPQPPSKPPPKPIPPIKPDPSTMGICEKSLDKPNTRETATKDKN